MEPVWELLPDDLLHHDVELSHRQPGAKYADSIIKVDLDRRSPRFGSIIGHYNGTPEECALSVLAEIVASRHGGSGAPLRERSGPLHRRDEASVPVSCAPPAEVRST